MKPCFFNYSINEELPICCLSQGTRPYRTRCGCLMCPNDLLETLERCNGTPCSFIADYSTGKDILPEAHWLTKILEAFYLSVLTHRTKGKAHGI
jgi:hypothetical protein